MDLSIIVAVADNEVIGCKGEIPWHGLEKWREVVKSDLKRFRQFTMEHPVIMGRRTYESILHRLKKPLPDRTNIVLTRDRNFNSKFDDVIIAHNEIEATQRAFRIQPKGTAYVIGGAQIYAVYLPHATKIHLTRINEEFEGDALFPKLDMNDWTVMGDIEDFGTHTFIDYYRM